MSLVEFRGASAGFSHRERLLLATAGAFRFWRDPRGAGSKSPRHVSCARDERRPLGYAWRDDLYRTLGRSAPTDQPRPPGPAGLGELAVEVGNERQLTRERLAQETGLKHGGGLSSVALGGSCGSDDPGLGQGTFEIGHPAGHRLLEIS